MLGAVEPKAAGDDPPVIAPQKGAQRHQAERIKQLRSAIKGTVPVNGGADGKSDRLQHEPEEREEQLRSPAATELCR